MFAIPLLLSSISLSYCCYAKHAFTSISLHSSNFCWWYMHDNCLKLLKRVVQIGVFTLTLSSLGAELDRLVVKDVLCAFFHARKPHNLQSEPSAAKFWTFSCTFDAFIDCFHHLVKSIITLCFCFFQENLFITCWNAQWHYVCLSFTQGAQQARLQVQTWVLHWSTTLSSLLSACWNSLGWKYFVCLPRMQRGNPQEVHRKNHWQVHRIGGQQSRHNGEQS